MEDDYLAGLLDGMGTIFVRQVGGKYPYVTVRVVLDSDETWLGQMFVDRFGGRLDTKYQKGKLTWLLTRKAEVGKALEDMEALLLRKLPAVQAALKIIQGEAGGVEELKKFNE